jgi:SWI/SNF-related matrix-associated actin-dependent regulator of chromatin subfamily A-like protein 1
MSTLRPYQTEGVEAIYHFRGRALLADEMGLGKTIQALTWIRKIPKRRPVVIVCPASVKYTWQAEAHQHYNMRTEVLEGRASGRMQTLPCDVVILNYEILKSWLPLLRKFKPQVIILDEIHYITNPEAQRTKAVFKLVKGAKSVVGLSGTPLLNRPVELWPVLKAIRPDLFPDFDKFAWRYCKPRFTPWGWTYDGATHTKELHRILRQECMIRRLKKDVLTELPDKQRRAVPFRLKSYVEYHQAQDDFLKWLNKKSVTKAKRASRSQALTKIGYLLRLVAELKMDWTQKWIEEFFIAHPDQKLVAFTMHTAVIDRLKERFRDKCVVIDGRVTGRAKHDAVRAFQNNRRIRLFLGNWKAAGIGITLTAASHAAALDLPWTPGALLQGEDRLHRFGQKLKVILHYLMAMGTIEEKQIKILRRKTKVLDAILNGEAAPEDLNFFDELLEEMSRSGR